MAIVHFVHGSSAAGSVRMLLAGLGRDERVLYLDDDLSFGPINPPSLGIRAAWCAAAGVDHGLRQRSVRRFWQAAVDPSVSPVAWFSHRAAVEVTWLLEMVWRRRDRPHVIDVAEVQLPRDASRRVGYIRDDEMREYGLLERARRLDSSEVSAMRTAWHWLRAENSGLRIVRDGAVTSAPLDHFDDALVALVGDAWLSMSTVLRAAISAGNPELADLGEHVIGARLRALVVGGQLEGQGDFGSVHTSFVRVPQ